MSRAGEKVSYSVTFPRARRDEAVKKLREAVRSEGFIGVHVMPRKQSISGTVQIHMPREMLGEKSTKILQLAEELRKLMAVP